ncbi:ornithine racemase Orr [Clostridiaceae bacterium 35-E11]
MRMPALTIDVKKIEHNTKTMVEMCGNLGIKVAAVTKGYCAIPKIAEASVRGGVHMLADSRIENLMKLKHIHIPKILLRLPMISQVDDVVEYADISLNSEYKTIKALSEKAIEKNKVHKVILMVDLGDLREGVWNTKAVAYIKDIVHLKGVELIGIGTNLTCYGGVLPSVENLGLLSNIAKEIEKVYNIKLEVVSGGNSSSVYLVQNRQIPDEINHLRFGEAILFGTEFAYGQRIENTYGDAFKLYAEVVELKEKPSVPTGEIGLDAFGEKPTFVDRGIRKRAILGIGKQDIRIENIRPVDGKVIVIGASSDHLIIDITDSEKQYDIGDVVEFDIHYTGMLTAMTSEYVQKVIID